MKIKRICEQHQDLMCRPIYICISSLLLIKLILDMMQQKLQEKAMVETSMVSSVGEIGVLKAQIAAKDEIIHQQQCKYGGSLV